MENNGNSAYYGGRMTMMEGDGDHFDRDRNRNIRPNLGQIRNRTFSNGSTRNAFGMQPPPSSNQGGGTIRNPPPTNPPKRPITQDNLQYSSEDVHLMTSGHAHNQRDTLYGSNILTEPEPPAMPRPTNNGVYGMPTANGAVNGGAYQQMYHPLMQPQQEEKDSYVKQLLRHFLYDTDKPEFTSLQQFCWAIIIGIVMGIFTAKWGQMIETCVEFVWKEIPEFLYENGIFTDLNGALPLPHYMWICPTIFGGVLSYLSEAMPKLPGQNEWIEDVHRTGVMNNTVTDFIQLVLISTAGMASGLSLGPELPLVLASGMVGSWLGLYTNQSILSARVMNLTTASAAIGGFFGFPMAGALFVLEIPHRMGLQYFEALSPATIASIIAVLTNRIITKNDLTGMFTYPFLTNTLPSNIFYIALIYGAVGSAVGAIYCQWCLFLKGWVHDWFHEHHDDHHHSSSEQVPLVGSAEKMQITNKSILEKISEKVKAGQQKIAIAHEPTRAAVAGVLVGAIVGVICMFLPHSLFWGEAQLQTLIDKGHTPLPIFGKDEEPTAMLTAYGYCQEKDFSMACAGMMALTKILVIGLSLGTGVCGGHFWGPLYVGAAFAQFFTDLMTVCSHRFPFLSTFAEFPCVAILCIMSSTHVVIYRAHMSIMLILTLSISAFGPDLINTSQKYLGGDYSAVFPLLVVSCFIPLMCTRSYIFYKKQRSRGDIVAIPEVLCEPKMEGSPLFPMHAEVHGDFDDITTSYDENDDELTLSDDESDVKDQKQDQAIERGRSVRRSSSFNRSRSSSRASELGKVQTYGEITDFQPDLFSQARERASSVNRANIPRGRHSRNSSRGSYTGIITADINNIDA